MTREEQKYQEQMACLVADLERQVAQVERTRRGRKFLATHPKTR